MARLVDEKGWPLDEDDQGLGILNIEHSKRPLLAFDTASLPQVSAPPAPWAGLRRWWRRCLLGCPRPWRQRELKRQAQEAAAPAPPLSLVALHVSDTTRAARFRSRRWLRRIWMEWWDD